MIRFVRWLVRLEVGIWRSLLLWIFRRVPGRGPRSEDFGYAKEVTPILIVFIFLSALEIPVVHVLIPWPAIKLALLIVGVWGVLWMVGYLAGMRVFRHLIDADGLRIRQGAHVDLRIPWDLVADVSAKRGSFKAHGLKVEDGVAYVPVLNQTRVSVGLARPVDGFSEVRFYVDDPRGFVEAGQRQLRLGREVGEPAAARIFGEPSFLTRWAYAPLVEQDGPTKSAKRLGVAGRH